ncbi:hypothetical protein H6G80_03150 [Nostoc sp. FACHB-87]|uniref:hypothetical protein n=1 Tax=Nostocaceae TaxID=1162 RepID=UPI001688C32A|nr:MULTISPECIES: hypothetical protein [Nostocaceae]MBD2416065.1 hypothetical protein [Nostoc calcicola FACHB-3891]MBD2453071.1 hypothetical protein [Nostoc sp. FACHB-87]MBD2475151.1 hypothetical protein [Anabaena sp. FACHB-83]
MAGKLGPRATVLFKSGSGQGKGAKSQYVYMLRSVAEKLGLKIVPDATVTRKAPASSKGKKEIKVSVRGSFGAKRVKVPLPGTQSNTATRKGVKVKYLSVPVPADATIADIKKFLQGASKKPQSFVSPNGRTYSLSTK